MIKAGFAGDDYPHAVFSNIVGEAKYAKCMAGALEGVHVGENVQKHRGMLRLRCHFAAPGLVPAKTILQAQPPPPGSVALPPPK